MTQFPLIINQTLQVTTHTTNTNQKQVTTHKINKDQEQVRAHTNKK
jgi:hypothetical protein